MHERVSVNALCFQGADLAKMAEHWRALKPSRIGFMSQMLPEDLAVARNVIAEGPYRFESMVHLLMTGRDLEAPQEILDAEQAKLSKVIRSVASLGGQSIYLLTGGRGTLSWEEAAARFCELVAPCRAEAEALGLKLMLEPATAFHSESHIAHSLRDTLTLAEMAGIGVNVDIFACWTEAGLKATIERAASRIHLVQVCDYVYGDRSLPCRAVPGDGNIPLKRIFDWLLSAGYGGAFDLELIGPRIDAEGHLAAARRAADNVGAMLTSLGA
jgi:sugar phosphate isomerase/epimerase